MQLSKLSPSPSIEMLNSLETEANNKIELNNRRDLPGLRAIGGVIQAISEWREKVREYRVVLAKCRWINGSFEVIFG